MKIDITRGQRLFLNMGSKVKVGDHTYYHFPYWIKETIGGVNGTKREFELLSFDKLPKELTDKLNDIRNETKKTPDS